MKRRLATLLVFLLLGAVINIAVAWGCVRWQIGEHRIDFGGFPSTEDGWLRSIDYDPADYNTMTSAEAAQLNVDRNAPPSEAPSISESELTATTAEDGGVVFELRGAKSSWDGKVEYNDDPITDFSDMQYLIGRSIGREDRTFTLSLTVSPGFMPIAHQLRAGWPCLSLYNAATITQGDGSLFMRVGWLDYRYALLLNDAWSKTRDGWFIQGVVQEPALLALPLLPVLPGFAINTLFYAALCWLLLAAPFALRRARRRRRGCCVKCAYPIGSNERCTECGAALP